MMLLLKNEILEERVKELETILKAEGIELDMSSKKVPDFTISEATEDLEGN